MPGVLTDWREERKQRQLILWQLSIAKSYRRQGCNGQILTITNCKIFHCERRGNNLQHIGHQPITRTCQLAMIWMGNYLAGSRGFLLIADHQDTICSTRLSEHKIYRTYWRSTALVASTNRNWTWKRFKRNETHYIEREYPISKAPNVLSKIFSLDMRTRMQDEAGSFSSVHGLLISSRHTCYTKDSEVVA